MNVKELWKGVVKLKIKTIIIVTLLLLIPVLIVGCGKDAQEEVVEEITPVPVAAEPTELTDEQYIMILMNISMRHSDGFQQLAVLSEEFRGDADWENNVNTELEKIRASALEYLELQGIPEKYSTVHEYVTDAMLYYILAVDAYPVKIEDQNVKSFNAAADYITKGTANIIKATEELDKIE